LYHTDIPKYSRNIDLAFEWLETVFPTPVFRSEGWFWYGFLLFVVPTLVGVLVISLLIFGIVKGIRRTKKKVK